MVGHDLDDEVEAYIVESALELPERAYRLVIHIAEPEADTDSQRCVSSGPLRESRPHDAVRQSKGPQHTGASVALRTARECTVR